MDWNLSKYQEHIKSVLSLLKFYEGDQFNLIEASEEQVWMVKTKIGKVVEFFFNREEAIKTYSTKYNPFETLEDESSLPGG